MSGSSRFCSNTQYIYKPLKAPNKNIYEVRLVELLPAACQEEPLRCRIRHESLSRHVSDATPEPGPETRFEALSYAWGNAALFDKIFLDDIYIDIGQNLSIAMRCLRLANRSRVLWIDAICINQIDTDEKNAQVTLMYMIYSQAKDVVIFLNEPIPLPKHWNVKRAFTIARRFAEIEEVHPQVVLRDDRVFEKLAAINRVKSIRFWVKGCKALRVFFDQPWFERMWVVQEAACARHATILCGKQDACWHDFMKGVSYGIRSGLFPPDRYRKVILPVYQETPRGKLSAALQMYYIGSRHSLHPHHINEPEEVQRFDASVGLFALLRRFHGSQATNPRDKIFALLGLASLHSMGQLREDLKKFKIQPDYRVDVKNLFCRLAEVILKDMGSLDLLSIPSSRKDWPSWVPDWSSTSRQIEALSYSTTPKHRCSGDSKAQPMVYGDVLVLKGKFIDNIAMVVDRDLPEIPVALKRVSRVVDSTYFDTICQLAYIGIQILEWETLEPFEYPSGESRLDVYKSLIDGARSQHESQWFGSSHNSKIRKKISERFQRLVRRYEKILGHGSLRNALLAVNFAADGVQVFDARILQSKTIARTSKGYLVYAPIETRVGDSVTILQGGKLPFVVHRDEENGPNRLRGDCYVPGIMNGELWRDEIYDDIRIA
ncbi:hypothetical protein MMC27_008250 [Xylographa pallens]|nr:hypothetical protein [Xylographa pallens]